MADSIPMLSIVCPAYDEEGALPRFHAELVRVAEDLSAFFRVEILYVDDGSRDRTLDRLRELASADRRVRYLSLSRNFGHQAALSAGLENARGDLVITLDSDGQHPPSVIPALLEKWREGYEIVITIRDEDEQLSWFKRLTSRAFYATLRRLSVINVPSAAADFRLLSRRAVQELLRLRESHRFLRGLVQWVGLPTAEVHYRPAARVAGRSKYNLARMAAFACDGIVSFSCLPLRLPLYLGGLLLLAAFVLGVGVAGAAWLGKVEQLVPWLCLVALQAIGGTILCSLGVLGEYVGRILAEVQGRPLYVIKETDLDRADALAPRRDSPSRITA